MGHSVLVIGNRCKAHTLNGVAVNAVCPVAAPLCISSIIDIVICGGKENMVDINFSDR